MNAPPSASAPAVVLSRVPPEQLARYGPSFAAVAAGLGRAGVPFATVDSIYDLHDSDAGVAVLRGLAGGLILLGWHYPRALRWILARHGIAPNATRALHCLDARAAAPPALVAQAQAILANTPAARIAEPPAASSLQPRWYPVVDYSLCTNCMACMDFCLFGVYGVDSSETLRVVSPDQCRQDCPACARVCPTAAILFPKYASNAAIAGADAAPQAAKLDLSALFGKPAGLNQAAAERDAALRKTAGPPPAADKIERLSQDFDNLQL